MPLPETSLQRSPRPIRRLSASDLGVGAEAALRDHASNRPDDPPLPDDDPLHRTVLKLLESFGGVIFTGPPGTGKSWHAAKIGRKLVDGDESCIRVIQFHPSYQYEDFMQGFVPKPDGSGFLLADKHFVEMCRAAEARPRERFVLVIDELSRGEPGRVFGEALTYVEKAWRGIPFGLSSGDVLTVPPNLAILATMNPLDRGVDEVDAAFERRFAKIAMPPDGDALLERLAINGVPDELSRRIAAFFSRANNLASANPHGAIGHTYFFDVTDEATLRLAWDHQLSFLIERAYQLDPATRSDLEASFQRLLEPPGDAS